MATSKLQSFCCLCGLRERITHFHAMENITAYGAHFNFVLQTKRLQAKYEYKIGFNSHIMSMTLLTLNIAIP